MRVLFLSLIWALAAVNASAQAFLGLYGTDNNITQVRENPAFAVHEDRAQINFSGFGAEVGGNSVLFKRSIFSFIFTGKAALGKDYVKNNNDQPNKTFWANMEYMGPGASFRVKKRYFFSVNTGMRYLVNSNNLDKSVYNLLGVNAPKSPNLVDSYSINNYSLTGQVFSELDLTYAGFIYESEEYKLVGGATVKLLHGISAAGLGIPSASFKTYNNDGLAHNVIGTANLAFTPNANKWALTNSPLRALNVSANNFGAGADLGLVYYMNPNETMMPKKGYVNRFAVSVTDIGSISYTSSTTTGSYAVRDTNINYRGIQNTENVTFGNRIFNDYLADTIAVPTGSSKKFKVGLPTALHLNGDFKIEPRFFVNGNILINLRKPSADYYSNHYITTITVTPRYVIRNFGVSMPFSFNVQMQGYLGAIVFVGPAYFGSASLFQIAASNSINNANFFLGANLRIKPKRQKEKDMMMM